jgi:4'-phosphopantetheinyl transferase
MQPRHQAREHLDGAVVVRIAQVSATMPGLAALGQYLLGNEAERAARYRFAEDRARFVIGRALTRTSLGHYLGANPLSFPFAYTKREQPVLMRNENISFSITHTGDYVAVALTANARVGIDIEHARSKADLVALSKRILSTKDRRIFTTLPVADSLAAFFRIWTRKEAYLKARGEGISDGLQKFSVSFSTDEITTVIDERDRVNEAKWRLHSLKVVDGYTGCVACDDPGKRIDLQKVKFKEAELIADSPGGGTQ